MNNRKIEKLASECLAHLKSESSILQSFVNVCHQIRESLGSHDDAKIESLRQEQQRIESESERINTNRNELRAQIASALDQPLESVSIRSLQERLSGEPSNEIDRLRSEIVSHVEEIKKLSESNTVLLQHNIDVFRRLILAMNGQEPGTQTYSAKGELRNAKINMSVSE